MKHIYVDRQDAVIHRLEEEEVAKAAKSEERLDAAVHRREEKKMKEAAVAVQKEAAVVAKWRRWQKGRR